MSRMTQVMKEWNREITKRINVKVGNYIYTVDVLPPIFKGAGWLAKFMNPEIDNFTQTCSITKKDIVEYIKEASKKNTQSAYDLGIILMIVQLICN